MAFEIIKADIRVSRMVGWFTGICSTVTDLVVGSKLRTKFEAIAVEMEEQDYQFYAAVKKAIPVAVYQAFTFSLLPASKAAGAVTFTANPVPGSDINIPAGTRVATTATATIAEKVFVTVADGTILAGQATTSINVAWEHGRRHHYGSKDDHPRNHRSQQPAVILEWRRTRNRIQPTRTLCQLRPQSVAGHRYRY